MSEKRRNREDREKSFRLYWKVSLGATLVGVLDSAWLLWGHLAASDMPGCSVSGLLRCDIVRASSYSTWFGVPVPFVSFLFYLFLFALVFVYRRTPVDEAVRPAAYLWLASWISVVTSATMAIISFGVLRSLCTYCLVLYAVSSVMLYASLRIQKAVDAPWFHFVKQDFSKGYKSKWFVALGVAVLVVLPASSFLFKKVSRVSGPKHPFATVDQRTLGSISAPHVIQVFSDFQCPFCKVAAELLGQLEWQMRGKVKIVYKFFPLDAACNSYGGMHRYSCRASEGAYCASEQGKFWAYHDLLFTSQENLPESLLFEFAKQARLDLGLFADCMRGAQAKKVVLNDLAEGYKYMVDGTPAIFIDGQKYSGEFTVAAIASAIGN